VSAQAGRPSTPPMTMDNMLHMTCFDILDLLGLGAWRA
jgi:hypothetical protein